MRKADVVLVALGVLALGATLVGALSGDRWTDERTVRFAAQEEPLAAQGPVPAGGAGARLNWSAPANATSATFLVSLTFDGQAVRGGNAIATVRVTGPDGRQLPPVTQAWAIPQGATSGQLEMNATAVWRETPDSLRDTRSGAHGIAWSGPIEVLVTVERPAGDVPLATYSFEATVQGTAATYREA
jgi:hypothetical protein